MFTSPLTLLVHRVADLLLVRLTSISSAVLLSAVREIPILRAGSRGLGCAGVGDSSGAGRRRITGDFYWLLESMLPKLECLTSMLSGFAALSGSHR